MTLQNNGSMTNGPEPEHVYARVKGNRIHCVTLGEGQPVLLIPGWPQTWFTWRHVMQALAAAGFKAIAVDPPGIGDSDKPIGGMTPAALPRRCTRPCCNWGMNVTN